MTHVQSASVARSAWQSPSVAAACRQKPPPPANTMSIERLDPALDKLIAPDAKIEVLAEGTTGAKGRVWVKRRRVSAVLGYPEELDLSLEGRRRRARTT